MENFTITLNNSDIEIEDIVKISIDKKKTIVIDQELLVYLQKGRDHLDEQLLNNKPIYGINTGFGGNAELFIPFEKLELHQSNLLDFLSAGTGECFGDEYVRAIQLIIILALSRGWSAVRPKVVLLLAEHLNKGIIPQVPKHGSVGASGDLVPLSYVANSLCGKGIVKYNGIIMNASEALKLANIESLELKSKEGLALVNGTRCMSAVSCLTLFKFQKTFNAALGAVALVVEALLGSKDHYDMRIHNVKNHPGQISIAELLNNYFNISTTSTKSSIKQKSYHPERPDISNSDNSDNNSGNIKKLDKSCQEVYSLRCAPQILGIVLESIQSSKIILKREILSVNDNPLIDPCNGDPLSGGNFMGNHIARTMDGIKLDISLVANHLHSLVALLMYNGFSKGLPNSLSPNLGIYQGFKGMQISQTSLVVWLRQEAAPACIHNLTTEQFNQDVISLGLHSALGAQSMEEKLLSIVSMTLLMACQAIDLRFEQFKNDTSIFSLSENIHKLYKSIRNLVPKLENDRPLDIDIKIISNAIRDNKLDFINY